MKRRDAPYENALLPYTIKIGADGRLLPEQNTWVADATTKRVAALLQLLGTSSSGLRSDHVSAGSMRTHQKQKTALTLKGGLVLTLSLNQLR